MAALGLAKQKRQPLELGLAAGKVRGAQIAFADLLRFRGEPEVCCRRQLAHQRAGILLPLRRVFAQGLADDRDKLEREQREIGRLLKDLRHQAFDRSL